MRWAGLPRFKPGERTVKQIDGPAQGDDPAELNRLNALLAIWSTSAPWLHLQATAKEFEEHRADDERSLCLWTDFPELRKTLKANAEYTETIRLDMVRQQSELAELHRLVMRYCPTFLGQLPTSLMGDAPSLARAVKLAWGNYLDSRTVKQVAEAMDKDAIGTAFVVDRCNVTGKVPTAAQIAAVLGVSRAEYYRLRQNGDLKHTKAALKAARDLTKGRRPPSGTKDAQGNLDACDEEE
jgi:hypothetical protein